MKPIDINEYRRANMPDGSANLACPTCAGQWWRSPGIVLDADTMSTAAWAYPLTCVECGHVLRPPERGA